MLGYTGEEAGGSPCKGRTSGQRSDVAVAVADGRQQQLATTSFMAPIQKEKNFASSSSLRLLLLSFLLIPTVGRYILHNSGKVWSTLLFMLLLLLLLLLDRTHKHKLRVLLSAEKRGGGGEKSFFFFFLACCCCCCCRKHMREEGGRAHEGRRREEEGVLGARNFGASNSMGKLSKQRRKEGERKKLPPSDAAEKI